MGKGKDTAEAANMLYMSTFIRDEQTIRFNVRCSDLTGE